MPEPAAASNGSNSNSSSSSSSHRPQSAGAVYKRSTQSHEPSLQRPQSARPYFNAQDLAKQQFEEAYRKALLRKQIFKEYLARHLVLERVNEAIEALYNSPQLPEDPLAFVARRISPPAATSSAAQHGGGGASGAPGGKQQQHHVPVPTHVAPPASRR